VGRWRASVIAGTRGDWEVEWGARRPVCCLAGVWHPGVGAESSPAVQASTGLAVTVPDHALDRLNYSDADKDSSRPGGGHGGGGHGAHRTDLELGPDFDPGVPGRGRLRGYRPSATAAAIFSHASLVAADSCAYRSGSPESISFS
jgi:hypothetical protein